MRMESDGFYLESFLDAKKDPEETGSLMEMYWIYSLKFFPEIKFDSEKIRLKI